ncbi:hypothetical protein ACHQM5_003550 [Ranunculus cassubicifolius]
MSSFGAAFMVEVMKKSVVGVLTCSFALGGSVVGTITGAIAGQTTETGFIRGAGIGFVAGGVVGMELFESLVNGADSLSKIRIIGSIINGNIFRELVSPAMLKAYQWQVGAFETSYMSDGSDIFDVDATKGLLPTYIQKLPKFNFNTTEGVHQPGNMACSICLQDFEIGDDLRRLPKCRHSYHCNCIDRWLLIQGSCPICREDV